MLGHSSSSFSLDVYGHFMDDDIPEVAAANESTFAAYGRGE